MNILIFIAVIVVLIVVHELGHFIAAKLSGMRVEEFGLGYPPRAMTITTVGETTYTMNWLPFGGFVKIYGENGLPDDSIQKTGAFASKSRLAQAFVLAAGVTMNLLLAYVLIVGALVVGTPRALYDNEVAQASHAELAVANVFPDTPAARAGLVPGDSIVSATNSTEEWSAVDPTSFSAFVARGGDTPLELVVKHEGSEKTVVATPMLGLVASDPSRYALGVEVATIGVVPVSFGSALVEGAILTWDATILTAQGLAHFFYGIFTMSANLSQIAGPVGIAGVVGTASMQGAGYLFSIMAIISINLALINLIPIPALDGGRLAIVIIESIIRRPIKASVSQSINVIGFVFLILLMVVVTVHDIFKIVT